MGRPFVGHEVELSVELTHRDGLGVEYVGQCRLEAGSRRRHLAPERCLCSLQNLVALCTQTHRSVGPRTDGTKRTLAALYSTSRVSRTHSAVTENSYEMLSQRALKS